jgi:hypothetical protein
VGDEQKKGGAALYVTVFLVAAVLLYPASFGPVLWLTARAHTNQETLERVYSPILWLMTRYPGTVSRVFGWWGSVGMPPGDGVVLWYPPGNHLLQDGNQQLIFVNLSK